MTVEKRVRAASGWPMLFVNLALYVVSVGAMVLSIIAMAVAEEAGQDVPLLAIAVLVASIVLLVANIFVSVGFFSLQPGQARVCILFGTYVGTVRESGFFWANPF